MMGRAVGAHDGIVTCGVTGQVGERCCSGIGLVGSSVLVDWYGERERKRDYGNTAPGTSYWKLGHTPENKM